MTTYLCYYVLLLNVLENLTFNQISDPDAFELKFFVQDLLKGTDVWTGLYDLHVNVFFLSLFFG